MSVAELSARIAYVLRNELLLGYILIPSLALFLSVYSQTETGTPFWRTKLNAACELFALLVALDGTLLIDRSSLAKMNSILTLHYDSWLVVLLLIAIALMMFSGRTQCAIDKANVVVPGLPHRYPFLSVMACWCLAIALTGLHAFLIMGK